MEFHEFDLNILASNENDFDLNIPANNEEEDYEGILTNQEEDIDEQFPTDEEAPEEENITDATYNDLLSSNNEHSVEVGKCKNLSNAERRDIYLTLLQRSVNGRLKKGTTKTVASLFSVSMSTIQRIWKRSKESSNGDVSHRRTKNCGRKRIQIDLDAFRSIPLSQRTTIRSVASALKIHPSTLHRLLQAGVIRRHSNAIKPLLKEENKRARLKFCLSMIDINRVPNQPEFVDMYNIIHIDEKWFYLTKKYETYYLVADEEEPHRMCKSKNFVEKVMFLAAIARPRFDLEENVKFTGKIGIYPFVTKEPAKRNSINRAAGTMETKVMTSVGKHIIRSFLIDKVLASIRSKWPREDVDKPILIQQDNARTHLDPSDLEFCEAAKKDGFDISLMCQPANSPDLNVLDLGFFNAIQSLRYKEAPRTIDELVAAVEKAFEEFSPILSNRIFLTLQSCMLEIMKVQGSNRYKIPHMNKGRLERNDELPRQLRCDINLIEETEKLVT